MRDIANILVDRLEEILEDGRVITKDILHEQFVLAKVLGNPPDETTPQGLKEILGQ